MRRDVPAVKTAMTPFPQTIQLHASVADAWKMMTDLGVRHLPVAEGSDLVGVVSGRDVGLAMDARLGTPEARGVQVADVCERHAFVVDLETPVDLVARELAEREIGSALVVKGEKLAGIFTVTDACQFLADFLQRLFPVGPGDEAA